MNETMDRRTLVRNLGLAGTAMLAGQTGSLASRAGSSDSAEGLVVAMVGTHHIHAPSYAQKLKTADGVTLKYVWDPDTARAQDWAKRLGATVASSPEQVWADPQVR